MYLRHFGLGCGLSATQTNGPSVHAFKGADMRHANLDAHMDATLLADFTDASLIGKDVSCTSSMPLQMMLSTAGVWLPTQAWLHSNLREMEAMFLAMKEFVTFLSGK